MLLNVTSGLIRVQYAGPLNIGNDREISVLEVARYVSELFGGLPIRHLDPVPQDPTHRCPDLTLARQLLPGWRCAVQYREGIAQTAAWFQAKLQPDLRHVPAGLRARLRQPDAVVNEQTLVSVVIPAFNADPFLERTLRSALDQTHRHLELIIVDDGSTDGTRAIAQTFADHDTRIRVVRTVNGGVARARNIGMEAARGSLLAFLDADDLWHPAKIALQVAALNDDVALVYTLTRVIDTNDAVVFDAGVPCDGYALARHLYIKGVGNGSSLLVRREVAQAVGGYDPVWVARGIGGCEDLDFELKVAAHYAIATVPLFLTGYRVSPGNMSSNTQRMARAMAAVVETHVRAHPELPRWAAQRIRAATMRSGLETLRAGAHHAQYALLLAHLFRLDPKRASDYLTRFTVRHLRQTGRNLRRQPATTKLRCQFRDLLPETGAAERVTFFRGRERTLMARLRTLDAELAARNQLGFPAARADRLESASSAQVTDSTHQPSCII